MAKLTLTGYIAEVKLACRNIPTDDPFYDQITKYVNRARNKIIRMAIGPRRNVDLFPEMQNSWTVGPLTSGSYVVPKPTDAIVIYDVSSAQLNTAPNWSIDRGHPLRYIAPVLFNQMTRDTTRTGWPTMYTRSGISILVHPTPSASFTDYLKMFGTKSETYLAAGADTFWSDEQWDDMTVLWAAGMVQLRRGWSDKAKILFDAVKDELANTADVQGLENLGHDDTISVDGAPSRATVYD